MLAKCSPLPVGAIVLGSGYYTDISEFNDHDLEVAKRRARIHEDVNFVAHQNLTQNRQWRKDAPGVIDKLKCHMEQNKGVILSGPAGSGKMTVAVLAG